MRVHFQMRPRNARMLAVAAVAALAVGAVPRVSSAATLPPEEPRLLPADPSELGIPLVPKPNVSDRDDAVDFATALGPYDELGTDADPGEFPRTLRHAMGETEIAVPPQRVVVLDVGELDAMVQLGIIPVGAVEYNDYGLPPFIVDQIEGVELVGTVQDLNFEAIAALDPDLIISSRLRHEADFDRLAEIAPTVFAERPGVAFKQNFRLYAQAVGREGEAATVVAAYEDEIQRVSAALPAERPTVSIVQLRADGVRFYLRANFLGVILTDVGLPRSDSENVDDFALDLSEESLGDYADGELLIASVAGGDDNAWADDVLSGPIWAALPAVEAGAVFEVDSRTWIGGVGYGAALEVLDGIADYFATTGDEPAAGSDPAASAAGIGSSLADCVAPPSDDFPRTIDHALGVVPAGMLAFAYGDGSFSPWFDAHMALDCPR